MNQFQGKLLVVTIFSLAMGLLESAVVIYLRELMYPEGFDFPLSPMFPHLLLTEVLREAATVIMLLCIGILAGKTFSQRFGWFIYSFAIWDIFYYVFLWLLIGWPESLFTWDVLFLLPTTWTGPVITTQVLTVAMIVFALIILREGERGSVTRIKAPEWMGLSLGSLVVIIAFIMDYTRHMLSRFSFSELFGKENPELLAHAQQYIPESFPWLIYSAGVAVIIATIARYAFRIRRSE